MRTFRELESAQKMLPPGKAGNLFRLARAGFLVPESLVLEYADLLTEAALARAVERVLDFEKGLPSGSTLAIRSSASLEDSASESFAGIFESVLRVKGRIEIESALRTCLGSLHDERVKAYCDSRKIPLEALGMSVLVQEMIEGEVSGVFFTIDALTGHDRTHVIEAVAGSGERLVQGEVTPERYRYDWFDEKLSLGGACLSEREVKTLSALGLEIQKVFGTPQDIEWTKRAGNFYILQSRPITRIFFEVEDEWTNANMKDGGVSSSVANPLIASLYRMMMNRTMPDYFIRMKMLPRSARYEWVGYFCGNLYWNLSAAKKAVSRIPGFIEREFDQGLGISANYSGDGRRTALSPVSLWNGIWILRALKASLKKRPALSREVAKTGERVFQELAKADLSLLSDEQVADRALALIDRDWFAIEGGYFYHIYDNSNCRTLFMKHLDRMNRKLDPPLDYFNLISDLGELPHLAPLNELWRISRQIRMRPEVRSVYENTSAKALVHLYLSGETYPGSEYIQPFLETYGYHSARELDLLVPCWEEDPTQVFESLCAIVRLSDEQDPARAYRKQHEAHENEVARIRSKSLLRELEEHRALLKQREELRIYSVKTFFLIRKVYLELGRRLVSRELIKSAEDVFFLDYPEVDQLARGRNVPALLAKLEKNRTYYQIYRNFPKPNEIRKVRAQAPSERPAPIDADVLRGVPASPGEVEAVVCRIDSVSEVGRLKAGSVLVTPFVDPAWTTSFIHVAGLITETGGVLSHGAVIAREYGFPAILAVPDATRLLRDGARIRMNGSTGQITILESP